MLEKEIKIPLYTVLTKQFPNALLAVAKRSQKGHSKYSEIDIDYQGFTRVNSEEYPEAIMRHLFEFGEVDESSLDHLAAVAWNALAVLELKLRNNENRV